MRAARVLIIGLLIGGGAISCRSHRMTADDCRLVLDRITELELAESGFRDPALLARRKVELRARFARDLSACEGRRARADALVCVRSARTAEELSHRCLR